MYYTGGFERFNEVLVDGGKKPWTVRVTHAYRREEGEWKIVHRHGDLAPVDESPPAIGEGQGRRAANERPEAYPERPVSVQRST